MLKLVRNLVMTCQTEMCITVMQCHWNVICMYILQ